MDEKQITEMVIEKESLRVKCKELVKENEQLKECLEKKTKLVDEMSELMYNYSTGKIEGNEIIIYVKKKLEDI